MGRFQHHHFSFNSNDEETEYGFFSQDGATSLTMNSQWLLLYVTILGTE